MSAWEFRFTNEALKDIQKLTPRLRRKLRKILLETVALNPHAGKRLIGALEGLYSL